LVLRCHSSFSSRGAQDDRKVVALTLAPNEEQLLAALDDGGLWALDLTRLNSLPVSLLMA